MAKGSVPPKLAKKLVQIRAQLGLSQTEMVKALNYKATPRKASSETFRRLYAGVGI